ncbi:hypothetical protein BD779DRAFT_243636 [Infundibulicybe gibba]|nr:hypothetical protein BD779DRAFT_243636 [Infundibulicybe gibba]
MLSRLSVRRAPRFTAIALRYSSSQVEGSVAQSKGFNKKEKAHEDEYARRHEAELLKKMREQIEAKKKELDNLEKEHQELSQSVKK